MFVDLNVASVVCYHSIRQAAEGMKCTLRKELLQLSVIAVDVVAVVCVQSLLDVGLRNWLPLSSTIRRQDVARLPAPHCLPRFSVRYWNFT
uniref:Uncharacterized protein n=1 Tax=Ascaris lumbricoides TaxID=6252 RepID=A0A0M3I3Z4_ASCLU